MAFSLRALAGAVVVLTACGASKFTAAPDTTDAGVDAGAADAAADAIADAGAPGPLVCPGAATGGTCELKSVCCMYKASSGPGYVGQCQPGPKCAAGNTPPGASGDTPSAFLCTRSNQCPNLDVCCIVRNGGGGGISSSSCQLLTSCTSNGGAVMCEMSHPTCPGGLNACGTGSNSSWGLPLELGTCGGAPPTG